MTVRKLSRGALMLAVCVLLPQIFHFTGGEQLGRILLPMHIPIFITGFLLGPFLGLIVGFLAPLLSHFLTGMPPLVPPILFLMIFELPTYGFVAGYLYREKNISFFKSLFGAMLAGRFVLALGVPVFFQIFEFPASPLFYFKSTLIAGIPGIVMQLLFLPWLFKTHFMKELIKDDAFFRKSSKIAD